MTTYYRAAAAPARKHTALNLPTPQVLSWPPSVHKNKSAAYKSVSVLLRFGLRCLTHPCRTLLHSGYSRLLRDRRGTSAITVICRWTCTGVQQYPAYQIEDKPRDEEIDWEGWRINAKEAAGEAMWVRSEFSCCSLEPDVPDALIGQQMLRLSWLANSNALAATPFTILDLQHWGMLGLVEISPPSFSGVPAVHVGPPMWTQSVCQVNGLPLALTFWNAMNPMFYLFMQNTHTHMHTHPSRRCCYLAEFFA